MDPSDKRGRTRGLLFLLIAGACLSLLAAAGMNNQFSELYPKGRHPEIGFATRQKFIEHYGKHGREFGPLTKEDYLRLAQDLRDRRTGAGVLEFVRDDRVITRFDRKSGAFLAFDRNGTIRTFFKPNDGEAYFKRQQHRDTRRP